MVQYYTLEEAAALLHLPLEKLKEMVKRNEVRAFQDRGTLRFRKQEIDELVRARGFGSDPELQFGDPPAPSPSASPSSRKRSKVEPATFNFADDVPLGGNPPSGAQKSGSPPSSKRKTTAPKSPSPRSPYPRAASDSDVRLVSDADELDFRLDIEDEPAKPRTPGTAPRSGRPRSPSPRPTTTASESKVPVLGKTPPLLPEDSDVKIEGEGEGAGDSVVPIGQAKGKSPSDSDIRLEGDPLLEMGGAKKRQSALITEEIDLDAEQAHIEEARKRAEEERARPKTGATPPLPTSSPFELSDNDLSMGLAPETPAAPGVDSSGDYELTPPESKGVDSSNDFVLTSPESKGVDSSNDFVLTPPESKGVDSSNDFVLTGPDSSSPLELGSDEVPKLSDGSDDEEVSLGDLSGTDAAKSGINLQDAGDSGLSLEKPGSQDELDFNLSLDAGNTPQPAHGKSEEEASSEFELSLPDDEDEASAPEGSDSEFELTLDEGSSELDLDESSPAGSDSEFELTLDEEGGLGVEDTESASDEEGKDIFETDFDVPALDDESGSQAAAGVDGSTDLESSEFELTLDDDSGAAEETGTEDFAIEEGDEPSYLSGEEDEPAPAPRRKTRMRQQGDDDDDGLDISLDDVEQGEVEEEEELEAVGAAAAAPPTEWGPLPAIMLFPAVIVLVVVGLMGFELVQGMWGFHKPMKVTSLVLDPIARTILGDDAVPKE